MGGPLFVIDVSAFGSLSNSNYCLFFFKKEKKCQKGVPSLSFLYTFVPLDFSRQSSTAKVAGALREAWLYQSFKKKKKAHTHYPYSSLL